MPFAIMFMPTSASAPPTQIERQLQAVISAAAMHAGAQGAMRSADGINFIFARHTIRLSQLSPGMCQIVFDVAKQTNTYVDTEGSDARPIKVLGVSGEPPKQFSQVISAASAPDLCFTLKRRLWEWNKIEKMSIAFGVTDTDGNVLEPPPAPGSEARLAADPSGIATQCAADAGRTSERMGWRQVSIVISQNPKWGVVWRADFIPANDPKNLWREICWCRPGPHGGLMTEMRPLQIMNDTVAPLAPTP